MADHDDKNPGKKVKNSKNEKITDQVFRVEFPKQLIEEFPFLGFPDMEEATFIRQCIETKNYS